MTILPGPATMPSIDPPDGDETGKKIERSCFYIVKPKVREHR